LQQSLGVVSGNPVAGFGDSNRDHFVLRFIDCFQNGRGGEQGYFVLAAASAKQDANPEFSHSIQFGGGLVLRQSHGWYPFWVAPIAAFHSPHYWPIRLVDKCPRGG
jgi:hypothetical protein